MYQTISEYDFIEAFREMNRENNFSYDGRKTLFEYLEESGEEIELDIIALCCEFTEYENIDEYLKEYDSKYEPDEFDTEEEFKKAVFEEINENTQLIMIDDESFIIAAY